MPSKSRAPAPKACRIVRPSPLASTVAVAMASALVLLVGIAAASAPEPSPTEVLRSSDEAFNQAAAARDRGVVEKLLAEDAVFFADQLHRGRQAFLDGWAPLWEGKYDFSFKAGLLQASVAESGDLGFAIGTVETRFQHPVEPAPTVTGGHYLNVWSRRGEGDWHLRASTALVVHAELGAARDPRSGLMTAWPELADRIGDRIEIDWRPEHTERAASGELAYTLGSYAASFGDGEDRRSGEGHFLAVWQRNAAGAWQLAAEGFTPPELHTE
ncbi:MAG: nuclear transport factor 2 family protein [Acidobacteriota bacterium]